MRQRFWRVVGAQLLATLGVIADGDHVIGIPFAVWKLGRLVLRRAGGPLRPTSRCARPSAAAPSWSAAAGGTRSGSSSSSRLLGFVAGPVLDLRADLHQLPLLLINLLGALIFALLIPYVAIGRTLLYFDLQVEAEEAPAKRWRRAASATSAREAKRPQPARADRFRRREAARLQRPAPRPRPGGDAGRDVGRGRRRDRGRRLRLGPRGAGGDDRGAGGDRDARPCSSPATTRPSTPCATAAVGLGARRPCCTARARRSTESSSSASAPGIPVTPWDWSFDLDDAAATRDAGGLPRRRGPRPPLAAPGPLRLQRRRRPFRQPGAARGDRGEAAAARRLRPHPRVLGLREQDRRRRRSATSARPAPGSRSRGAPGTAETGALQDGRGARGRTCDGRRGACDGGES